MTDISVQATFCSKMSKIRNLGGCTPHHFRHSFPVRTPMPLFDFRYRQQSHHVISSDDNLLVILIKAGKDL